MSQTLLQKEVKQTARQKGSCQTVPWLLHTDLLLSFFFFFWHYVNSVWSCRRTQVDQSSLYYLFFDMRCSLLLLVIPFSLPVSLLFFFTCSLYRVSGSTWVCVFLWLSVHVKITWRAKKEESRTTLNSEWVVILQTSTIFIDAMAKFLFNDYERSIKIAHLF